MSGGGFGFIYNVQFWGYFSLVMTCLSPRILVTSATYADIPHPVPGSPNWLWGYISARAENEATKWPRPANTIEHWPKKTKNNESIPAPKAYNPSFMDVDR